MQAGPRRAALAGAAAAVLGSALGPAAGAVLPAPPSSSATAPASSSAARPTTAPSSVGPARTAADPLGALVDVRPGGAGNVAAALAGARGAALAQGTSGSARPGTAVPGDLDAAPVALAVTVPLGDLDGDGLPDLAHHRARPGEPPALEVRRGTDGALLWRRELAGPDDRLVPLDRDVSGDGTVDVLATSDRAETVRDDRSGDCATGPCRVDQEHLLHQRLTVLDGRTGAVLQQHAQTGRSAYHEQVTVRDDSTGTERRSVRELVAAGLVVPLPLGGARPGLLVQSVDLEARRTTTARVDELAGAAAYGGGDSDEESLRSRVTYAVHRADGTVSPPETTGWLVGSALAGVAADVTGDGQDDVLVVETAAPARTSSCERLLVRETCTSTGDPESRRVVLRDGTDLSLRWATAAAAGQARPAPLAADLDGDGAADVLVVDPGPAGSTTAVSGRAGRRLWSHDQPLQPLAAVPLDGGPQPDLLLVDQAAGADGGAVAVERRDGGTGTLLLRTEHAAPALPPSTEPRFPSVELALSQVSLAADRDGDAVPEVAVSAYRIRFTDQRGSESTSRTAVESGRSGAAAVLHEGSGLVLALGSDDLDGDGRGEVLVATEEPGRWTTRAVGTGPAPLWSAVGLQPVVAAGDLDGRPGAELVGTAPDELVVRDGRAYTLRWQA